MQASSRDPQVESRRGRGQPPGRRNLEGAGPPRHRYSNLQEDEQRNYGEKKNRFNSNILIKKFSIGVLVCLFYIFVLDWVHRIILTD